ncbi:MAG: hypothetical protein HFJ27_00300 [Clostridia bacterium]|nr:hypothetical protein [Clostridia bacterium]
MKKTLTIVMIMLLVIGTLCRRCKCCFRKSKCFCKYCKCRRYSTSNNINW